MTPQKMPHLRKSPFIQAPLLGSGGLFSFALLFALSGCKIGGGVTARPLIPFAQIDTPTLTTPSMSPSYSNASSFRLVGMCMIGETVLLAGDEIASTPCVNSVFSFEIKRTTDGIYSFQLTQLDLQNRLSAAIPIVWIRKSTVSAPVVLTPTINPFASAQAVLTISGNCENGATINVSNGGAGQACV